MTDPRPRALLLDRDGTVIDDIGYPRDPALVRLRPEVECLGALRSDLGYRLVLVGNQSGVGRGLIRPDEAAAVQAEVERRLAAVGVGLDGAFFCFHRPDEGCACRKPRTGLLRQAAQTLGLELRHSVMVGDKESDVGAGRAAGCATVSYGPVAHPSADASFERWSDVAAWLRARG
ncbi:MAG: HAD-IIIA family hydrolase [Acidimicrobiales bacterium]|nr:HAD-IIIA family hydrolase [Acidimicrobiales bacterium]MCB9373268.1 HAD-IIIA family hydrolase [Microthrixaceae bacterium]